MIYSTFDELCAAISDRMQGMPAFSEDQQAEAKAWMLAQPDMERLLNLVMVYQGALAAPPEGVIGVGAISYAEQELVRAQSV